MAASPSEATARASGVEAFARDDLRAALAAISDLHPSLLRLIREVGSRQGGWRGDCRVKNATLASKFGCHPDTVGRWFRELGRAGLVEKVGRRRRFACRRLTLLGLAALALLRHGLRHVDNLFAESVCSRGIPSRSSSCARPAPGRAPGHTGVVKSHYRSCGVRSRLSTLRRSAARRPRVVSDPASWRTHRRSGDRLSAAAWSSVASWVAERGPATEGRLYVAEAAFSRIVSALAVSPRFLARIRRPSAVADAVRARDRLSLRALAEEAVVLAVSDARRRGARFASVESATAYVRAVLEACARERREPGSVASRRGGAS